MNWIKTLGKNIQSLILAFVLALVVWVSAVTNADPTQQKYLPQPIPLEIIGQDSALVITNSIPSQIKVELSAPQSIWTRLTNETGLVRAILDLSDLADGDHRVPIQIQVGIRPVKIVEYSPTMIDVVLEQVTTREFDIHLIQMGTPAVGYLAQAAVMDKTKVMITGSKSAVERVVDVQTTVVLTQIKENVDQVFPLGALDKNGDPVEEVSIEPDGVRVTIPIEQRGGYRNVVVKVVLSGTISPGYRVTNISVYPPAITVFSADPQLVEELPGYVETLPIDLSGAKDDQDLQLQLNLPPGVSVVGDQTVEVQVGIATIEGSLTLNNQVVEIIGLSKTLTAVVAPETVDVILSGPLPILDALRASDLRVTIDVSDLVEGTYQRIPQIELNISDLTVESILPGSVEVTLTPIGKNK
jgi:YbbR domain-containing protein